LTCSAGNQEKFKFLIAPDFLCIFKLESLKLIDKQGSSSILTARYFNAEARGSLVGPSDFKSREHPFRIIAQNQAISGISAYFAVFIILTIFFRNLLTQHGYASFQLLPERAS